MKNLFHNVVKTAALFFVVGALLAVVAPPLADLIRPLIGEAAYAHAVTTPVLWTGAFFSAFGAIDAALRPAFDWAFGDSPKAQVAEPSVKEAQPTLQIAPVIQKFQQPEQVQATMASKYRETIEAERMVLAERATNR